MRSISPQCLELQFSVICEQLKVTLEMKLLSTAFLIGTLSAICLGQKEPICRSDPSVVGNCGHKIKGYTYECRINSCKKFRAKACKVTGNFFRSRDACNAKCKDTGKPAQSGVFEFFNRTVSQFLQMILSLMSWAGF
ncbi:uncharacterized protein Dsimw501_GD22739 [Drosophila simulans]|uniref:BPTI/Kunitz inhibitor domain-containing protein n=2 Tax=Drosophila simulans TaxID=7240 RepID=A0A0J9QV64_DROSI|nr:uncharacterized protein Dsimw501_GD22739 [Drosophila simulans]